MEKEIFNYCVDCNTIVIFRKLKNHYEKKGYHIHDNSKAIADIEFPYLKEIHFELKLGEDDKVNPADFSYLRFSNGVIFGVVNFEKVCKILGLEDKGVFPINIEEQYEEFLKWSN